MKIGIDNRCIFIHRYLKSYIRPKLENKINLYFKKYIDQRNYDKMAQNASI